MFVEMLVSSMQTAGDRSSLIVTKAIARRFLVQPISPKNLQQPPANWSGNTHFSLKTGGCMCMSNVHMTLNKKPQ